MTMGFNCGIVGLPNVGKSTLFNALTQTAAAATSNYPFCTIEPNTGRVGVPDRRLDAIAAIVKPPKVVPTRLEFVDIAGLVKGASQGEGLGNQFLSNIREVDAIIHVLRCFEDNNVTHVSGAIDPASDAETVETELMLADLESLEKRVDPLAKKARGNDKEAKATLELVERALAMLREGHSARNVELAGGEKKRFRMLQLLSAKPVLYVCNVGEEHVTTGNALSVAAVARAASLGARSVVISARIEEEIAALADLSERAEFLETIGLEESGLARVIREGHVLLGLIVFFTECPNEVRAWTLRAGAQAPEAAGQVHTDFEHGFICAETIAYDDFVSLGGEQGAKEAGRMRQEGRDYLVQDGDILLFRFNL
jgi:hypothetical protein